MGRNRAENPDKLPRGLYLHGKSFRLRGYRKDESGKNTPYWINLGRSLEAAMHVYTDVYGSDHFEYVTGKGRPGLDTRRVASTLFLRARKRAKLANREFTITLEDVIRAIDENDGNCAVSGLPLTTTRPKEREFSKNPYAPSLDRIDSRLGYTPDNVRVVCCMANTAMSEWGERYLLILIDAVRGRHKKQNENTVYTPNSDFGTAEIPNPKEEADNDLQAIDFMEAEAGIEPTYTALQAAANF